MKRRKLTSTGISNTQSYTANTWVLRITGIHPVSFFGQAGGTTILQSAYLWPHWVRHQRVPCPFGNVGLPELAAQDPRVQSWAGISRSVGSKEACAANGWLWWTCATSCHNSCHASNTNITSTSSESRCPSREEPERPPGGHFINKETKA